MWQAVDLRTELLRRGFSGEEAEAYLDAGAPLRLTVWCAPASAEAAPCTVA